MGGFKGKVFLGVKIFESMARAVKNPPELSCFCRGEVTFIKHKYLLDDQCITMDPDLMDEIGNIDSK